MICSVLSLVYHPIDSFDYTTTRGQQIIKDDSLFQCVSISITDDSTRESSYECFRFQIYAAATIDGLSVEPSEAEICIRDRDCELHITSHSIIHVLLWELL